MKTLPDYIELICKTDYCTTQCIFFAWSHGQFCPLFCEHDLGFDISVLAAVMIYEHLY